MIDNLAKSYNLGDGVPQDYVLAHMWFNIAAANSDMTELVDYPRLRRKVDQKITSSQIEEAQKLAREWMEKHGKE